jgi:hypothetical protein
VAAFCDRFVALVSDDVVGDGFELVNLQDAVDLREESFEESEDAAGDAFDRFDRGDGLGVGEVVGIEFSAESFPVAVEDEKEFLAAVSVAE